MDWLEVSLTVSGESAEAVAEVLSRYAAYGVVTEQGVRHVNEEDEGTADGPITVRAYLPADAQLEETRQRIEESLFYLGRIQPLPRALFTPIADQNWMEAWKQHYRPIPIGQRLMVVPAWLESPDPGRIAIKINPGMAFGTGTHPSTQLCLALMEKVIQGRETAGALTCIDVGCGSGILSIAALRLGATEVLGVDIDPDSVRNARENAAANGIGSALALEVGSVEEILHGKFTPRRASMVTVNILAPVIVRLISAGLAELVEMKGIAILGGILQEQAGGVIEAAEAAGLRLWERQEMGDWVALAMMR